MFSSISIQVEELRLSISNIHAACSDSRTQIMVKHIFNYIHMNEVIYSILLIIPFRLAN